MEQPQQQQQSQQQQQQQNFVQQQISQNEKMNTSSYFCRQSTSRWTPTTEQIKLLKELYYINGVRSPSADQIQAICARLRRYGKIEGKNVFYWFQNHKARERQKKRLTPSNTTNTTSPQYHNNNNNNNNNTNNNIMINGSLNYWKQDENNLNNSYPCITNNNTGISCSGSSAGVVSGGGQLMGSLGYGAVNMENKFRDCSISGGGFVNGNVTNNNSSQWSGATNYNTYVPRTCYSNLYDHKYTTVDEEDQEQDLYGATHEIETLPLFPMHNEEHNNNNFNYNNDHHFPSTGFYTGGYRWSNGSGGNAASLELSLNSYGYSCYSNY